jgi:hypothetical protein
VRHNSSASIGALVFGGEAASPDDLLKRADIAMYRAKAAGRDTLALFETEWLEGEAERFMLLAELRKAIADDTLVLRFQPQMDRRLRVVGAAFTALSTSSIASSIASAAIAATVAATAIVSALPSASRLERLSLRRNALGDHGARALASARLIADRARPPSERELGAAITFADIAPEVAGVYPRIMHDGDMDAGVWSCGMVAGLIHDVPTVAQLITGIMDQAHALINERLAGLAR